MKRAICMLAGLALLLYSATPTKAGTFYTDSSSFNTGITNSKLKQLWQETFAEYNVSTASSPMPNPSPLYNSASLTAGSLVGSGAITSNTYANQPTLPTNGRVAQITGQADTVINAGNPSPAFLLKNTTPTLSISGYNGQITPTMSLSGVHAISLNFGWTDPNFVKTVNNAYPTGTWTVYLSDNTFVTSSPDAVQSSGSSATDFFGYIATGNVTIKSVTFTSSDTSTSDTQYVVLDNITAYTPEPASMTLLGIGIAGMAGYGWRRRKQAASA